LATISGIDNASPALKDAAAKLGALVAELNSAKARRSELAAETKRIADDQARIRQNLGAVGQSSDLGRRYVDALRKQEDRLAEIATADKALEAEMADKRKAAEELAKNLSA
jgi:chromosome segregation ATPase